MKQFLWILAVTFALLGGYWFLAIAVVTWFSYWYPAWPLFLVAVLIDGYYGAYDGVPVLSLGLGAFVLFVEALKIYLLGKSAAYE